MLQHTADAGYLRPRYCNTVWLRSVWANISVSALLDTIYLIYHVLRCNVITVINDKLLYKKCWKPCNDILLVFPSPCNRFCWLSTFHLKYDRNICNTDINYNDSILCHRTNTILLFISFMLHQTWPPLVQIVNLRLFCTDTKRPQNYKRHFEFFHSNQNFSNACQQ